MTVKAPRMTQLSWAETREILNAHSQALSQLHANDNAIKDAIAGVVVDGQLVSPVSTVMSSGFWGRLKWLLTGRVA